MKRPAFTLAELLVAILILGVIATFTIPKILQYQTDQRKSTVFKETFAEVNKVIYEGYLSKTLPSDNVAPWTNYILNHLNCTKTCSNSVSEGCISSRSASFDSYWGVHPGCVLPNGASIVFWNNCTSECQTTVNGVSYGNNRLIPVMIDWNGLNPPNFSYWLTTPSYDADTAAFNYSIDTQTNFVPPNVYVKPGVLSDYARGELPNPASEFNQKFVFNSN